MTLELKGVSIGYGKSLVIQDIDMRVCPGEIVALLGANGAGKSTVVKSISGLISIRAGTIEFYNQRIDALDAAERIQRGIVHVPEGRQIFTGLTVAENLLLGAYAYHIDKRKCWEKVSEIKKTFPALAERLNGSAGNLSGGQQQMLAIGRGLMGAPKLLILDEPSLGLAPLLVMEIFRLIATLRDQGRSILLSEQNARLSLGIADRAYVFENGRIVLSGTGNELLRSKAVAERYLGIGGEFGPDWHAEIYSMRNSFIKILGKSILS